MQFYENFIKMCVASDQYPSVVAEKCGLDKSAVTRWKQGQEPRATTIIALADYFGVDPKELLLTDVTQTSKNAGIILTEAEKGLLTAWRKATYEEQENIAFLLRKYGFNYERPVKKRGSNIICFAEYVKER